MENFQIIFFFRGWSYNNNSIGMIYIEKKDYYIFCSVQFVIHRINDEYISFDFEKCKGCVNGGFWNQKLLESGHLYFCSNHLYIKFKYQKKLPILIIILIIIFYVKIKLYIQIL